MSIQFDIYNNKSEITVKTNKLQNAAISLIKFDKMNEISWNESYDRLTEYIENDIKWISKNIIYEN